MDKNDHTAEEYKHISSAIIDIHNRVLQVFGIAVTVSVSLLSVVAGLALGKEGTPITVILAYAALGPDFLLIPAFYLMVSQRADIMRLGSYRRIFFEEHCGIEGWETQLERFRKREKAEPNDPIPYTIWAIFLASAALFGYGVVQDKASLFHLLVLFVPLILIVRAHYRWGKVVAKELPRYLELWREVSRVSTPP